MYLNGNFETVLGNIKTLDRIKKETGSAYPVIFINSIGFKHHIERLPDFVDLMACRGVEIINVNGLVVNAAFPEMVHHAAVYNPGRDAPVLDEARRRADANGVLLGLDLFMCQSATSPLQELEVLQSRTSGTLPPNVRRVELSDMQEFASKMKAERPTQTDRLVPRVAATAEEADEQMAISPVLEADPLHCMEPFCVAYIRRDGNVMPCCLWPEHKHSFGNVTNMTGSEVWNGHAFQMTRDAIVNGVYPQGCHFCVKSRVAPQDPQLGQALSFIKRYKAGFGVDLSELFPAGPLRSAASIVEGFRGRGGIRATPE